MIDPLSLKDPFRRPRAVVPTPSLETIAGSGGYTAWASRYLHAYGATKDDFGLIAARSLVAQGVDCVTVELHADRGHLFGELARETLTDRQTSPPSPPWTVCPATPPMRRRRPPSWG